MSQVHSVTHVPVHSRHMSFSSHGDCTLTRSQSVRIPMVVCLLTRSTITSTQALILLSILRQMGVLSFMEATPHTGCVDLCSPGKGISLALVPLSIRHGRTYIQSQRNTELLCMRFLLS